MANVYLSVVGRFVRYPRVLFLDCWCFDIAGQERKLKWRIFMLSRVRWLQSGPRGVWRNTINWLGWAGRGGEGGGERGRGRGGVVSNLD